MPRHKHPLTAAAVAALLLSGPATGMAQATAPAPASASAPASAPAQAQAPTSAPAPAPGPAATAAPVPAPKQVDPTKALLDQGRYWQSRSIENATVAWEKLLLVDPGNEEALASLGKLAIVAKKFDAANGYLARLRKARPDSQQGLQLEQDISFASDRSIAELDQARIALREQKYDVAIAKYRGLFRGRTPQGAAALEYYSVLGYSTGGWAEAVAGLERLQRTTPGDARIQLELANLKTLHTETQIEGLRGLAALTKRKDVGGDATEHLRSALGWMGAPPPARLVPFFQEYLKENPDDKEIRAQFTAKPKPVPESAAAPAGPVRLDPLSARVAAGYAALEANDIDRAETEFQAALKLKARSGPALGGMGLVRLRQQKFSAAREFLAEASRQDGAERWKQSLDSAAYWDLVGQATVSRDAGRLEDARQKLEQAVQLDPLEPTAENALGGVYTALKRPADAERVYRDVLSRKADNLDALRGLVGALAAAGRGPEALKIIDGLSSEQRARIDVRKLRAEQSMGEYRAALALGETAAAREKLEDAVSLSPDDPWIRLDLARIYLKAGSGSDARGVMTALLQRRPNDPDVVYPTALLLAEMKDWGGTFALLDRIPAAGRTPPILALYTRAGVNAQVDAAVALSRAGRRPEAAAQLGQAEGLLGANPDADLLGLVVQTYVNIGDTAHARALLRTAMRGGGSPGVRLQYAELLLRAGEDAELAGLLREFRTENLEPGDREHYDIILRAYVSRQVEALRTQGDLPSAYDLLAPLLAATPDDPVLLSALARLYSDAGQPDEALRLYRQVLARTPDDAGALMSVGILSTVQHDYDYAEQSLLRARQLQPENADVVAALGRLYRVQGRPSLAAETMRTAVAMLKQQEAPPVQVQAAMPGMAPAAATDNNPFAYLRRGGTAPPPAGVPAPGAGLARPAVSPPYIPPPVGRPAW
jgi:tetratricopeptide (TPR) repeat protein